MSTNPNDPFQNPNAPQHMGGPGAGQPGYADNDFAQPRKSNAGKWLIGCGLVGLVGALVCCGGVFLMGRFGLNMMGEVVRAEIENSPTIVEHIGEIESLEFNLGATSNEAQAVQPGQAPPLVFDIQGTKGSGQILAQQSAGDTTIDAAVLVLPSGDRFPLELSGPTAELQEFDVEVDDFIQEGTSDEAAREN